MNSLFREILNSADDAIRKLKEGKDPDAELEGIEELYKKLEEEELCQR